MKTNEEIKDLKRRADEIKNEIASLSREELAVIVGGTGAGEEKNSVALASGSAAAGVVSVSAAAQTSISLNADVTLYTVASATISTNFNAAIVEK